MPQREFFKWCLDQHAANGHMLQGKCWRHPRCDLDWMLGHFGFVLPKVEGKIDSAEDEMTISQI
eukprot:9813533-Lingulodinium_polyedra.AAC.1